MAVLLESVRRLQGDEACMHELAKTCGFGSSSMARSAYVKAAEIIIDELGDATNTPTATKSLLGRARSLQHSDLDQPARLFTADGASVGDDLVREVLGPNAASVISVVAERTDASESQARGLVEITTGVVVSTALRLAGEDPTLESLTTAFHDGELGDASGGNLAETAAPRRAEQTPQPLPASAVGKEEQSRGKVGLLTAVGVVCAIVLAGGVFLITRGGDESETLAFAEETTGAQPTDDLGSTPTDADTVDGESAADEADADADVGAGEDADAGETAGEETSADASPSDDAATAEEPTIVSPPIPIGAPPRHAVMSRGKIFLRGYLPTEEEETQLVAAVAQVVGPHNVVSEYVIDPVKAAQEEPGEGVPVYIDETVLFAPGSAEVSQDFVPLLGIGLTLLNIQEGVTLEVTGHTDSDGSDAANLQLSQARVDAVKAFFVSQGIDADRITAIGKGETDPRADNTTADGRRANRRVEFLVKGFSVGG